MSSVSTETATILMHEIQKIEQGTDLKRIAVISRIGMAIASATSNEMDADAETASSSALIDLADRLSNSVVHGDLREILVKAESGFVILRSINEEYMIFGGISDPLKIGYYMEYLRNISHRFAYILAGNQVTDELKKEMEADRDRDLRLQQAAKAPLTKDFIMDKSNSDDIGAMQDVLSFLNDWGGDSGETKASANNIVGIDNDLMFGMDDFAPQPISATQIAAAQEQIQRDQGILPPSSESTGAPASKSDSSDINFDDIFAALDNIAEETVSPSGPAPSSPAPSPTVTPTKGTAEDLDDVLAALTGMAEDTPSPAPAASAAEMAQKEPQVDDILSALGIQESESQMFSPVSNPAPSPTPSPSNQEHQIEPPPTQISPKESQKPDLFAALNESAPKAHSYAQSSESTAPIFTAETPFAKTASTPESPAPRKAQKYPYGIPMYPGEVPPVPLEDYVSFEIGTLTAANQTPDSVETTTPEKDATQQPTEPVFFNAAPSFENPTEYGSPVPDFHARASEYDDLDMEEAEDAMLQALAELDFDNLEKKNQKKRPFT